MAANPSIQLGTDGNWAIKEDNLLAYKKDGTRFFNKEFDFTRNTTATFVDQNGLIQESATNTPRIDFTDDATGHLLLEPQRTNLINYSEDFSNGYWVKTNTAIQLNSSISPDGTLNASKLTPSTLNSIHKIASGGVPIVNSLTSYWFVKSNGYSKVSLREDAAVGKYASFDLSQGIVLDSSTSSKIEDYGNGWFRIELNDDLTNVTARNSLYVLPDSYISGSPNLVNWSADGTSSILIWGAQSEEGSYATSYIPTYGSTATRNADVCNNSGTAQDFNSEEGVLYAEISALADDITNRVISLSNGTNNNIISVQFSNVQSNDIIAYYNATGQTGRVISTTSYNIKSFNKIALVWNNSSFKFYVNGYLIGSATIETPLVYGTLNQLKFQYGNSTLSFYGNVKDVRVFKRALSDGELYLLTVPQYQSYQEMATALNYTL